MQVVQGKKHVELIPCQDKQSNTDAKTATITLYLEYLFFTYCNYNIQISNILHGNIIQRDLKKPVQIEKSSILVWPH